MKEKHGGALDSLRTREMILFPSLWKGFLLGKSCQEEVTLPKCSEFSDSKAKSVIVPVLSSPFSGHYNSPHTLEQV